MRVVNDALDKKQCCATLFMDLSKAFAIVDEITVIIQVIKLIKLLLVAKQTRTIFWTHSLLPT